MTEPHNEMERNRQDWRSLAVLVPLWLWTAIQDRALEEGRPISDLVREAIMAYVA